MTAPFISDDAETDVLFQIIVRNLVHAFGHEQGTAEQFVRSFYRRLASRWDDDFYHHEGAFRSAALLHYSASHHDTTDFSHFHEWYRAQDLDDAAREAAEYFRAIYFTRDPKA